MSANRDQLLRSSLEDFFVVETLVVDQVATVEHAAGVGEEGHGLREPEHQPSDVSLPLGRLMGRRQLGDVALHERGLATEAGNRADVGDGFDGQLENKAD